MCHAYTRCPLGPCRPSGPVFSSASRPAGCSRPPGASAFERLHRTTRTPAAQREVKARSGAPHVGRSHLPSFPRAARSCASCTGVLWPDSHKRSQLRGTCPWRARTGLPAARPHTHPARVSLHSSRFRLVVRRFRTSPPRPESQVSTRRLPAEQVLGEMSPAARATCVPLGTRCPIVGSRAAPHSSRIRRVVRRFHSAATRPKCERQHNCSRLSRCSAR